MSYLNNDIKFAKGIGEKRAQLFKKRLGLFTMHDLLTYYPRSYEDWSTPFRICDVPINQTACLRAKIASNIQEGMTKNRKIKTYSFFVYDRTGQIRITIYQNKYLATSLKQNQEYLFYGKVKWSGVYREMSSPEIRSIDDQAKFLPIYPATEGISSRQISRIMNTLLESIKYPEFLPKKVVETFGLLSHEEALRGIHSPTSTEDIERARQRLAFEELLFLRLGLMGLKQRRRRITAKQISPLPLSEIHSLFTFTPTRAQQRVIQECMADMQQTVPMNRLLQGDVGSGKTAVAAALCYTVQKSGYQSIFLAPTELLAVQHATTLSKLFFDKGVTVGLLTGSLTAKEKRALKQSVKEGKIDVLVATHAVLTEDVVLPNVGLVITDEQHRFGVSQRAVLSQKANHPHTLVMSATPIPRTMGLVVYGDLDISILDETPAGRSPIQSFAITPDLRERAIQYVKKHLDMGYQGYVVCPMIEAEEESELVSATEYADELHNTLLKGYTVGLLHGKMKPKEKDSVMQAFANGAIQVLVSTTVIEVGIDVPNAVIMVIENAERFGLSQLHQLRGRVGRGSAASSCIFISASQSKNALERLQTLCKTNDGFVVAEADLKLRGPGNFLGKEQHGLPRLKIADLIQDQTLLQQTLRAAKWILSIDNTLSLPEHKDLKNEVNRLFEASRKIIFN